jgi:homoserine/homoserine lactone efflux protein
VLRSLDQPHHLRWMNRTFGALFVAAGTLLATFRRAAV